MATDPTQFNNKEFEKLFKETIRVVADGISGLGSQLNEAIIKGAKETTDKADKDVLGRLRNSIRSSFKSIEDSVDNLSVKQEQIKRGSLSYNQVVKNGNKLRDKVLLLETKRNKLLALGQDFTEKQKADFEGYKEDLEESLQTQEKFAKSIEEKAGSLGEIFSRLAQTPVVGQLLNAQQATEAMRESLAKGESSMTAFGAGAQAAFQNLERGTVILAAISAIVKIFKFVVGSMFRADELTTNLAKNLGISKENARGVLENLQEQSTVLTSISYQTDDIIAAQAELVNITGAVTRNLEQQAGQQAFLTKFVGLQGDEAAFLNIFQSSVSFLFPTVYLFG